MREVNIDIQRTGFPVKIGRIELWFDCSLENLRNYFDLEEIAKKKLEEAQEKAKHIHFPDEIKSAADVDVKSVDAGLDLNREHIAIQYDIIFGDGTFKKLYKTYPDILALEKALTPVSLAIAERITEVEKERIPEAEARKNAYLNKKKNK